MKMALGLKTLLLSLSLLTANAKTLKVDTLTPSVTNGDLTLSRDGTGDIVFDTYNGLLKAASGVVSAGQADLTSEVTGILPLANGGTGSATQNFVDLTTAQSVAGNKTLTGSTDIQNRFTVTTTSNSSIPCPKMTEAQRDVLATPTSGDCVFNTDTDQLNIYAAGAWGIVAGGGGGSLDIVYQEDFEGQVSSSDFTCGTNLTAADDTSTPLNDDTSITFTQGATPPTVGIKCAGPTVNLPVKAQAKNLVEVCFEATYTGNDNEVAVNIESGGSDLVQVLVEKSSTAKKHCGYFSTSSTVSVDLDIEILTPNADEVLEVDDVEITIDPLTPTDIYASSEWQSYTPTFSGFGTPTAVNISWRRDGQDMVIEGTFDTGTVTANPMAVSLPSGYSLDSSILTDFDSEVGSASQSGTGASNQLFSAANISWKAFVDTSTSSSLIYLTDTTNGSGGPVFSKRNANAVCNSGTRISFKAKVPIAGWSDTAQGVVVKNRTDSASVENHFSAKITNNGTTCSVVTDSENVEWLGTCTRNSLGTTTTTINSGISGDPMNCFASTGGSLNRLAEPLTVTNTSVQVETRATSGTLFDIDYQIFCSKRGTDYIKETDKVYTVDVANLRGNWVRGENNAGTSLTASATDIDFIEVTDTASAWDGDSYTVQESNSKIDISAGVHFTTASTRELALYKNGTLYANLETGYTSSKPTARYLSSRGEFAKGDVLSIRSEASGTLDTSNTVEHYLNIVEEYPDTGVYLGSFAQPTCYVKDVKSSGTNGGTATSGAWRARDLNTLEGDCSFLSLASNTITIEAGAYNVNCKAPFRGVVNSTKVRLYNSTDALTAIVGETSVAGEADDYITPEIMGKITITSPKDFLLQYQVVTTKATQGLGIATGFSENEVYSQCSITKVR
jgi:hypothetical protein